MTTITKEEQDQITAAYEARRQKENHRKEVLRQMRVAAKELLSDFDRICESADEKTIEDGIHELTASLAELYTVAKALMESPDEAPVVADSLGAFFSKT